MHISLAIATIFIAISGVSLHQCRHFYLKSKTLSEEITRLNSLLSNREESADLTQFLADLTQNGVGVVKISTISLKDLLLRTRRHD
jgi:hypothetical protein